MQHLAAARLCSLRPVRFKSGGSPKCIGVFDRMLMGIFHGCLSLTDATQSAQRRSSSVGECLTQFS